MFSLCLLIMYMSDNISDDLCNRAKELYCHMDQVFHIGFIIIDGQYYRTLIIVSLTRNDDCQNKHVLIIFFCYKQYF